MSAMLSKLLAAFEQSDAQYAAASEAHQKQLELFEDRKDAAGNPQPMTDAEKAALEKSDKALDEMSAGLNRQRAAIDREKSAETRRTSVAAVEASNVRTDRDVGGTIRGLTQSVAAATIVESAPMTVSQKMGAFVQAAVLHKANPSMSFFAHMTERGMERLGDIWRNDIEKDKRDKILSGLTSAAGAYNIPTVLASEFIPWLYPQSAFLAGQPVMIDLSAGNIKIPGGNASATASYRAEGSNAAYSDATFREVALSAKNLAAVTSISNELIERSPSAVDAFVQGDLARAFTTTMDLAGLRADGSSNQPTGIRSALLTGQKPAAAAGIAPSVATVEAELLKVLTLWATSNIPAVRPTWVFSPRVLLYLQSQRDGNGNMAWPMLQSASPMLKGFPVLSSTQVPVNLGVGTNESEIYLIDFGHVYFGDTKRMSLLVSQEATFDVSGTLHSAFSKNLTVIRMIGSHDIALRYANGAAMLTAVQWGAAA